MDERRSYSGLGGLEHAPWRALVLLLILGFAAAPKFEDSQEAIPVETVSRDAAQPDHERREGRQARAAAAARANSGAQGRTDAALAAPAAARPAHRRRAEARAAAPAKVRADAAAEARAAPRRPSQADMKQADFAKPMPEPPRTAEGVDAREAQDRADREVRPDRQGARPRTRSRRTTYDPNAIAKLIAPKAVAASSAASATNARPQRRRACRITTRRACRCRWPRRSTRG